MIRSKLRLSRKDKLNTIKRYNERFKEFGYSPKSLGWWGGKQDLRFEILTSQYYFEGKSVLDIGCGFGDLVNTLRNKFKKFSYTGVDINEGFIEFAKTLFPIRNVSFQTGEFLDMNFTKKFDYAIGSGIFNHKFEDIDNYKVIETFIKKSLDLCYDGLAFDFNNDKRKKREGIFYSSPEKILSIAFKYSKNIVLRNDYMPYEFAIFIFKDDSFSSSDNVFRRYKKIHNYKPNKR